MGLVASNEIALAKIVLPQIPVILENYICLRTSLLIFANIAQMENFMILQEKNVQIVKALEPVFEHTRLLDSVVLLQIFSIWIL